jgi:hypothetical protein
VQLAEITDSVKAMWLGLTATGHEKSLVGDLNVPTGRAAMALERICFYYPKRGEQEASRLLSRHVYDSNQTDPLALQLLQTDPKLWDEVIQRHIVEKGDWMKDAIAYRLLEEYYAGGNEEKRERLHSLLHFMYPGLDPFSPPPLRAVPLRDQTWIVQALVYFDSEAVDTMVDALSRDIRERESQFTDDWYLHEFFNACLDRRIDHTKRKGFQGG